MGPETSKCAPSGRRRPQGVPWYLRTRGGVDTFAFPERIMISARRRAPKEVELQALLAESRPSPDSARGQVVDLSALSSRVPSTPPPPWSGARRARLIRCQRTPRNPSPVQRFGPWLQDGSTEGVSRFAPRPRVQPQRPVGTPRQVEAGRGDLQGGLILNGGGISTRGLLITNCPRRHLLTPTTTQSPEHSGLRTEHAALVPASFGMFW
jgi:hypothetical protein